MIDEPITLRATDGFWMYLDIRYDHVEEVFVPKGSLVLALGILPEQNDTLMVYLFDGKILVDLESLVRREIFEVLS